MTDITTKYRKNIITLILVTLALVGLSIGLIFLFKSKKQESSAQTSKKTSVTTKAEDYANSAIPLNIDVVAKDSPALSQAEDPEKIQEEKQNEKKTKENSEDTQVQTEKPEKTQIETKTLASGSKVTTATTTEVEDDGTITKTVDQTTVSPEGKTTGVEHKSTNTFVKTDSSNKSKEIKTETTQSAITVDPNSTLDSSLIPTRILENSFKNPFGNKKSTQKKQNKLK